MPTKCADATFDRYLLEGWLEALKWWHKNFITCKINVHEQLSIFLVKYHIDDEIDARVEYDEKIAGVRHKVEQQCVRLEERLDDVHNQSLNMYVIYLKIIIAQYTSLMFSDMAHVLQLVKTNKKQVERRYHFFCEII